MASGVIYSVPIPTTRLPNRTRRRAPQEPSVTGNRQLSDFSTSQSHRRQSAFTATDSMLNISTIKPHSISAEASPRSQEEDIVLTDAAPADPSEDEEAAESGGSIDAVMHSVEATKDASKTDINLNDMFDDDVDEDEDFPSSGLPANGKMESSPSAAAPL